MLGAKLTHPSAAELTDFAIGKLDDERTDAIAAHLGECEACRVAVESAPVDAFGDRIRAADRAGPVSAPSFGFSVVDGGSGPRLGDDVVPPELAEHPRYRIVRKLGQGGMGVVYLAQHKVMDDPRAIKVISQRFLDHPDALSRFHREVKAAAKLKHPNIAAAYDAEQFGNLHTLVMEYVEGKSLDRVLGRKGPFPVGLACNYIRQAALGLHHAFEHGMVHRDIKPQNLMLTPRGQIKLLDFGLARLASERKGGKGLTADGAYMGTPEFMSPEQATDARQADIRADIYSLGCTLFYLLTGRPPFQEDTLVKMALAHINQPPPDLNALRPDVPAKLAAIVAKMLAKNPADRFQTPVEVARALQPFVKVEARPAPVAAPYRPPEAAPPNDTRIPLPPPPARAKPDPAQGWRPSVFRAGSLGKIGGLFGLSRQQRRPVVITVNEPPADEPRTAPKRSFLHPIVIPAILLGAMFVTLAIVLGVVLTMRTKDGTVELSDLPEGAEVFVDQEKVSVKLRDGKKAEVRVKPDKTHKVEVKVDGVVVLGEFVTVSPGGRESFTVRAIANSAKSLDGFQILQARFGTEGSWADVTDEVKKLVRGNKIAITLSRPEINRWPDPAVGKAKILVLAYSAGGKVHLGIVGPPDYRAEFSEQSVRPNDGAVVSRSQAGIQILQARFGTEGSWADVTDEVKKLVRGNKLTIALGQPEIKDRWPDPAVGKAKILVLAYSAGGRVHLGIVGPPNYEAEFPEAAPSNSPAPPVAPANPSGPDATRPAALKAPFTSARAAQEAWAKYLGTKVEETVELGGGETMTFVLIPPGEFLMGATDAEKADKSAPAAELPQHPVTITRPIYVAKYVTTLGQYKRYAAATSYVTDAERGVGVGGAGWDSGTGRLLYRKGFTWKATGFEQTDRHPVHNLTWFECKEYCKWLAGRTGVPKWSGEVRLTREAEWEYCCRAGTTTRHYGGDDPSEIGKIANIYDRRAKAKIPGSNVPLDFDDGYAFTAPVGQFKPNGFGLYDMLGNISHWCEDSERSYTSEKQIDPVGGSSAPSRVIRGSYFGDPPPLIRAARRGAGSASGVGHFGFRVVIVPRRPGEPAPAPPPAPEPEPEPPMPSGNDSIRGSLDVAKAIYDLELKNARQAVLDDLDKREAAARKDGDQKLVQQIKKEREAFTERDECPPASLEKMEKDVVAARAKMLEAYKAAVAEYTKAKKDAEAAWVEKQLDKFRRELWRGVTTEGAIFEDDFLRIKPSSSIFTEQEFTGPIEVTVVARTEGQSIRLRAYRGSVVIFNWEDNPRELRVCRPDGTDKLESGTIAATRMTPLKPNTWYVLGWRMLADEIQVLVNGQVVFRERRANDATAKGVVSVNALLSKVDVKLFRVRNITAE